MGTVTEAASGSVSTGGASCTPAVPTGLTSGDMLVCKVSWVNSTMVKPTMPGDWTELVSGSGGSAAAGNNVGARGISIFYKETDGTDSGTVTVTSGSSTNAAITARITAYDKDSGTWDIAGQTATDTSAGTSYSITLASDIGLAAGDYYFINTSYVPRANTPSSPSLSWSGVTFTGPSLNGSTANTNGWDVRQVNYDGAWSSGTSTAAPTFGFTASASIDGGCSAFVRLRAVDSSSVTGTLATTLAGATLAASGAETFTGTLASTLSGATLAASGAESFTGTFASTLDGATLAATGVESFTSTLASTLDGATLAATAVETIPGTLAATLDAATLAASGTAANPVTGTLAATLDGATLDATGIAGAAPVTGTLATTLAGATLSATGVETIPGTLTTTLDDAALAASGAVGSPPVTGTLATTLDGATLVAAGELTITGTIAATLAGATLAATGTETIAGTIAATLTGASLTASGTAVSPDNTPLGAVAGGPTTPAWAGAAANTGWGGTANGDRWAGGPAFQDIGGGS